MVEADAFLGGLEGQIPMSFGRDPNDEFAAERTVGEGSGLIKKVESGDVTPSNDDIMTIGHAMIARERDRCRDRRQRRGDAAVPAAWDGGAAALRKIISEAEVRT